MDDQSALQGISSELGLNVKEDTVTLQLLAEKINDLILNDFQKLVFILYRMDINETKLKQLLNENPQTDAGIIVARLMIERQEQKIKSRKEQKPDTNISEEEKW